MKRNYISIMIFAVSVLMFSSCNDSSNVREEQKATVAISGSDTSANRSEKAYSEFMKIIQDGMTRMKQVKMTGNPDYDFATMMVMHNDIGIKMADEEIAKGKDQELIALAKKIKKQQDMEKREAKNYTSNNKAGAQNKTSMDEMMKQMQRSESDMNSMKMSGDIDKDFAMVMEMHHQNGVMMDERQIKYGKNQKLKTMAQKSMDEQNTEIKKLQSFSSKKTDM